MGKLTSTDAILDFAIRQEEQAQAFYEDLATKVPNPAMKTALQEFAEEERGHREKLLKVKGDGTLAKTAGPRVQDLKLSDYVVAEEPSPDISYQDALILAMKKEKAAYRLYMTLASMTDYTELKSLLLWLANEEAKHKLRFEVEYDQYVLKEN
jgi:rubrerythrin